MIWFILGGLVGIAIMCLLQINREDIIKDRNIELQDLINKKEKQLLNTSKSYKGIINKQNKMINDMADAISSLELGVQIINEQYEKQWCEFINSDEDCCWKTNKECKDCIKEYFEGKVK